VDPDSTTCTESTFQVPFRGFFAPNDFLPCRIADQAGRCEPPLWVYEHVVNLEPKDTGCYVSKPSAPAAGMCRARFLQAVAP
jgi:hypothetical protein